MVYYRSASRLRFWVCGVIFACSSFSCSTLRTLLILRSDSSISRAWLSLLARRSKKTLDILLLPSVLARSLAVGTGAPASGA